MNEWFKDVPVINCFMIVLTIVAIVSFFVDGNFHAAIWALNTLFWVLISTSNEITIKDLRDVISELETKLYRNK